MDTSRKDNPKVNIEQLTMTLRLMGFLNASHYAVFSGIKGQTHSHSWQLQFEVEVPVSGKGLVRFEDLEKLINSTLQPYQRTVLNDMPAFRTFQPFTENIAAFFFNTLSDLLADRGSRLTKLVVWENPTKGVEVTQRIPFHLLAGQYPNKELIQPTAETPPAFKVDDEEELSRPNEPRQAQLMEEDANKEIMDNEIDSKETRVDNLLPPAQDVQTVREDDSRLMVVESGVETAAARELVINQFDNAENMKSEFEPDMELIQQLLNLDPYALAHQDTSGQAAASSSNDYLDEPNLQPRQSPNGWSKLVAIIALILLAAAVAYYPLLMAPDYQVYPWGSDTWGHLYKAKFLAEQIAQGNYFPQFSADWYNGNQPFRYWAPLPYYILAGIYFLTGNIFVAGNYYIVFCALLGAFGWLAWRRRIPLGFCLLLAVIWLIWPDNVRVAMSEGNFPRILATALLPWLVISYLNTQDKSASGKSFLITVALIHLSILCHAMLGAVYCVALFLYSVLYWLWGGSSLKAVGRGLIALILGIMTSAWWLLPALSGGLIGMGSGAAGGVQYIPAWQAFNPAIYRVNRETFYLGISIIPLIILVIVSWKQRPRWAKAIFVTGLLLTMISFPTFRWLHNLMPLSGLLWPLRFRSIAGLMLLASACGFHNNFQRHRKAVLVASLIVLLLVAADSSYAAKQMIFTRVKPFELIDIGEKLQGLPGWRVATLDISSLGSAPSFIFNDQSNREQVFGWAWQGATTSSNIMLLNTALERQLYPFVIRQITYLGATDVVINNKKLKHLNNLESLLKDAGFSRITPENAKISYWHGGNQPYMLLMPNQGLVIGKFANMYALQFPSLQIGSSNQIDDYTLNELTAYPLLILAGANWNSAIKAENLIIEYARKGGRVIVDLNGFPEDVFSKQSKFLNVYGQTVTLGRSLRGKNQKGDVINWRPFATTALPWDTIVPMPLDEAEWTFNYMNRIAVLFGYKYVAGAKIGYLGANAIYHAFLTGDVGVRHWLGQCLGLKEEFISPVKIPVRTYQIETNGYRFQYNLPQAAKVIIPVAKLEGMKAYLDGKPIEIEGFENLAACNLPAGKHTLRLVVIPNAIYTYGLTISGIGGMLLLLYLSRKLRVDRVLQK